MPFGYRCPPVALSLDHLTRHWRKLRKQASLRSKGHAGLAHRGLEVLDQRIQIGLSRAQPGVSGLHVAPGIVAPRAEQIAELLAQRALETHRVMRLENRGVLRPELGK